METSMVDIVHRVGIQAPASQVYAALTTLDGLAGWWTRHTSSPPGPSGPQPHIRFSFRDTAGQEMGAFDMAVLQQVPDQAVHWRVASGPPEWVGTQIEFGLAQEGATTVVRFAHRGWREEVEFMAHCSMKWATFLLSLRQYVETGTGRPAPGDLKIDNWN
jgi:uncharacterized protein YndB with AHSA1/START domain